MVPPPIATASASTTAPNQSIRARAAAMTPVIAKAMVPMNSTTINGVLSVAAHVTVWIMPHMLLPRLGHGLSLTNPREGGRDDIVIVSKCK